jgi:reactive intermediate/imine deaminase
MNKASWALAALACCGGVCAEPVEFLNPQGVMAKGLPFSPAVKVGAQVYVTGQIGNVPGTTKLVAGGMAEEARQTIQNIKSILEANGYTLRDVVKCTVMLADMSEWAAFNEVYKAAFAPPYPARSAMGANGLAFGAKVELDCIAAR